MRDRERERDRARRRLLLVLLVSILVDGRGEAGKEGLHAPAISCDKISDILFVWHRYAYLWRGNNSIGIEINNLMPAILHVCVFVSVCVSACANNPRGD